MISTARAPISQMRSAARRISSSVRMAHAGERFGLRHVGRDERRRAATAPRGWRRRPSPGSSGRPCLLTMTGSTTSGKPEPGGGAGHGPHHFRRPERAGLGRGGRDILEHGLNLFQHQRDRHHFHARHAHAVLHRQQSHHGFAVDAELVKRLEVGLNAGPAAGVGAGDGQGDGRHHAKSCCARCRRAATCTPLGHSTVHLLHELQRTSASSAGRAWKCSRPRANWP